MIIEIFKAITLAGIPIALFSYYLIILTSTSEQTPTASNSKELKKELKNKTFIKDSEESLFKQMLRKKYIKFGGGFYGVLTFITYIHIEINQVLDFIRGFSGFKNFIDSIGLSMAVNFFIEAIMNLVLAFMWPIYWAKYMPIDSLWVWLIVAVIAHSLATRYALFKAKNKKLDDTSS